MHSNEPRWTRKSSDDEPFSALAFKIMTDPFVGVAHLRADLFRHSQLRHLGPQFRKGREGAGRAHAADARQPSRGYQGSARRRHRRAGGPEEHHHRRYALRPGQADRAGAHGVPASPSSRSRSSRRPKAIRKRWASRCNRLAQEDPSFRVSTDPRVGQTIIKGMGELHLEIIVDRMKREFKVDANVGAPQVAYRETITRKVEQSTTRTRSRPAARVSSRASRFASSRCRRVQGFEFENAVVGGSVPKEYVPGVEKGLNAVMETGVIAGFPMIDFKATLDRRRLSRSRFERARLRDRGARLLPRGHAEGGSEAAGAGHAGRGGDARGVHGRRHRRPEQPARPDHRHGPAAAMPRSSMPWCRWPTCSAT